MGEGVLAAAVAVDEVVGGAGREPLGALEHRVLEEVGKAGLAGHFVAGTDLVPQHVGDDRQPVVGHQHRLEAIVERSS